VILTHSFMVGLGMMALVIIQMGGVSQVSYLILDNDTSVVTKTNSLLQKYVLMAVIFAFCIFS
jgi:hypothetical protein